MSKSKFLKADGLVKIALRNLGVNGENYALFDIWEKEAGRLKDFTEVMGFKKGVMMVRASSPSCYQEILLSKKQLLQKINNHFGKKILRDIKVLTSNE